MKFKLNHKKIIAVSLSALLVLTQLSTQSFASKGKPEDKGGHKPHQNTEISEKYKLTETERAELREKLKIMVSFEGGNWQGLPDGMAKKGFLNFGLSKKYMRGDFPFGLAKRIKDFRYGDYHDAITLEDLQTLIASAEAKVAVTNTKVYVTGAREALTSAITAAKTAIANPTTIDLKTVYNTLKKAIFDFDNLEIVSIEPLKVLLVKLEAYKANYYSKLSPAKKEALDKLIVNINTYLVVNPVKPLTLGAYNEIVTAAKMFEDNLQKLKDLVTEAEALLYKDPKATTLEFKQVEGLLPGQYLVGSNQTLLSVITATKTFITEYNAQSVVTIESKYTGLKSAMTTFSGNLILGVEDINILLMVQYELQAYYDANYKPETPLLPVKALLEEMKIYTTGVQPLYQAKYVALLDGSKTYIKDLYDAIKLELQAKINMGVALLTDVTHVYGDAQRAVLLSAVNNSQSYLLGTTHKYDVLKSHIITLDNAITAFKASVVTP